ncbi:MAG TPA: HlyD family efflux transporter periplasmic adaptor subunit [Acidobacteriota bacterium]|nr:HlyD family efflux transporter periplasmic adaptor subunit [Acidobacteriota bacterium]
MSMDIPRGKGHKRKKTILRILYAIVGLAAVLGITYYLSQLEPAAPSVDQATLWTDRVRKQDLVVKVRGAGTLVPEEERFVPATVSGRIEVIHVKPGVALQPDTVILELSNPELERDEVDARLRYGAAKANYRNLEVQLQQQLLQNKASAAQISADYERASMEADLNKELLAEGLIDNLTYEKSRIEARNLKTRNDLEQERLENFAKTVEAQLEAQNAEVATTKALWDLRKEQLKSLSVRAGIRGQLQEVPVEVGQQVNPGENLARIAQPEKLMAEVRIAETQANEIAIGQYAEIDTRNGVIPGHVVRIDPAAAQGVVQVDVALDGELPQGARPQLSVDGTIQIDKLENVLVMGRPAYGQADQTIGLFKINEQEQTATRVQVQLGRSSVNEIEVKAGLKEGDVVILSDTSQHDDYDKIRLN